MCGLFTSIGYFCGSIDHYHATHISVRTTYACSFHYRYTYLIRTFHFTAYSTGITPTLACLQERSTPIATVHEVPSPSPVVDCALVASGVQKLSTNRCEVGSVKPVQNEPMNAAPRQQAQKKTMGGHSVVTVPFQKSMMGSSHHSAKKSLMGSSQTHCRTSQQWSDGELLYFTLVADGALPDGFIRDFLRLTPWVSAAAQRQALQLARTDDLEAALFLHQDGERRKLQEFQEKTGAEQFIAAAAAPPTKFKSRLHRSRFQGPTARKDAEESERQR